MTLGSHQRCIGRSQNYCTPLWILRRLGDFDLDPASANPRPWSCARENYTPADDGLGKPWFGRVFCNPPFDRHTVGAWIARMARHNHGILLTHARVETAWFAPIWKHASAVLFFSTRIKFHLPDGSQCEANSGA